MAALSLMLSTLTLLRLVYNTIQPNKPTKRTSKQKQVEKRLVTVNQKRKNAQFEGQLIESCLGLPRMGGSH